MTPIESLPAKLLPCPFCGGKAQIEARAPGGTGASGMEPYVQRVGCKTCEIFSAWEHPKFEWGKQHIHDQALAKKLTLLWNVRAALQPDSGEG